MLNQRSWPILLLPFLQIICTYSVSVSLADPQTYHQPDLHFQGQLVPGGKDFLVLREISRRSILDPEEAQLAQNNSLILAQNITRRRDPLDDFKYYQGGWNISNRHYIFSVAYTATPLIVITIIWSCGFAATLLIIFIRHCCCHLNRRMAMEEGNGTVAKSTSIILAAERTHRIDPLDHFHYYAGGWDYQNSHYLSSVAFSAAPLFATAIVWFVVLGLFLLCSCLCCCCCRKQGYGYSPAAYALSLTFLIVFTLLAIAGCVVLYTNQEKFSSAVTNVLDSLVDKAVDILNHVESVMRALFSAKNATLDKIGLPVELQNQIDHLGQLVNRTAGYPQRVSTESKQAIQIVLSQASLILDIAAAIMLLLVFSGFLFSICGWRFVVYLFVLSAWILITVAFFLCGVFLIAHNVVADTCVAMEDYLHNPTADSPLNLQFLPCLDQKTAQETFNTSKETTSGLVTMVNQYITDAINADLPPETDLLYHNQSGPLVPLLCDPYNPDMTNRTCDLAEVTFANFSKEWKKHVCQVSSSGNCVTEGRLTPNNYDNMNATANIAFSLYEAAPLMVELLDCSIVRDTFRDISTEHCPGLRRYSYRTYLGLVLISSSVMVACIFWLCYVRERSHRKYTKGINKGYMYG